MVMFVWWEAPLSMRVEWRCVLMTSGEQCVMIPGIALMLLWSVNSWGILEICCFIHVYKLIHRIFT